MSNLVEKLTPAERDALRLVARDRNVIEIARLLGKSEHTVTNQIKMARAKLGGVPAPIAARMLAEAEGRSQTLASLELAMAKPVDSGDQTAIDHPAGVAEDRAVFGFEAPVVREREGRPIRVSISKPTRLVVIVGAIAGLAAATVLVLASVFVLQLLYRGG